MAIKIEFSRIDVQGSRAKLRKRVSGGERVPFSISGYLDAPENDDGVSQEYAAVVTSFTVDGET